VTDDRLRDLLRRSHEADAPPPGFAATVRAARAVREEAAPPRRTHRLVAAAAAMALAAIAVAGWLATRQRDPAPALVAPTFEVAGPFDQLASPFPGLAVADLTLDGAGQPAAPEGLPIEDPW